MAWAGSMPGMCWRALVCAWHASTRARHVKGTSELPPARGGSSEGVLDAFC